MPHNKVDKLRFDILSDTKSAPSNGIAVRDTPPSDQDLARNDYCFSYLYVNPDDTKGWRNDGFKASWDCRTHWTFPMSAKLRRKIDKRVLDETKELHRWATQINTIQLANSKQGDDVCMGTIVEYFTKRIQKRARKGALEKAAESVTSKFQDRVRGGGSSSSASASSLTHSINGNSDDDGVQADVNQQLQIIAQWAPQLDALPDDKKSYVWTMCFANPYFKYSSPVLSFSAFVHEVSKMSDTRQKTWTGATMFSAVTAFLHASSTVFQQPMPYPGTVPQAGGYFVIGQPTSMSASSFAAPPNTPSAPFFVLQQQSPYGGVPLSSFSGVGVTHPSSSMSMSRFQDMSDQTQGNVGSLPFLAGGMQGISANWSSAAAQEVSSDSGKATDTSTKTGSASGRKRGRPPGSTSKLKRRKESSDDSTENDSDATEVSIAAGDILQTNAAKAVSQARARMSAQQEDDMSVTPRDSTCQPTLSFPSTTSNTSSSSSSSSLTSASTTATTTTTITTTSSSSFSTSASPSSFSSLSSASHSSSLNLASASHTSLPISQQSNNVNTSVHQFIDHNILGGDMDSDEVTDSE